MHKSFSVLVSLLFLLIGLPSSALSPMKDDSLQAHNWLVVPVFYITNRQYAGVNDAIGYSEEPSTSGLSFGVKNVVVPLPATTSWTDDRIRQMSWQAISCPVEQTGQAPKVDQEKCQLKDKLLSKANIVQSFQSYVNATGVNDSVVFVHGCCADFDTSMKRAAKIATHMGTDVLLYDWLSPVGFGRYLQNETRVKQTTDDFCRFLNYFDQVLDPTTVSLIGHSMGAEFIDQAMVRRAIACSYFPRKPYREIIMSNADVDARTYLEHAQEFASNASVVRLYISKDDDRLNASSVAHGGFARLGLPGPLLSELVKLKGTNVIDITEADSGHEIPFWLVAALHSGNGALPNPAFKLNWLESGYYIVKKTGLR